MSYSNIDTFVALSSNAIKTVYNIDFNENQIYKITNEENQRISLFENSSTSGILKSMNDFQFEIIKNEDTGVYTITLSINTTAQQPVVINSQLSAFRVPLFLSLYINDTDVTFLTYVELKLTDTLEEVYTNPSTNGFKINFSTTKIRNMLHKMGSIFLIETTYIAPPLYENINNYKLIKTSNDSVENIGGKMLYNIIRCI